MRGRFEYGVFLSRNAKDKPRVRQELKGVCHGT